MTQYKIYHFSIADSLLNSNFEGSTTIKEIKEVGDFGLGTLNDIDGEMIMINQHVYTMGGDGRARLVHDDEKTPIAVVNFFKKDLTFKLGGNLNYDQLINKIDSLLPTENIFYAIKIQGEFKRIIVRTISKLSKPYPSLDEIKNKMVIHDYENVEGIMFGYKSPPFIEGISVPGYHFHFIDNDFSKGGHVYDIELVDGVIDIQLIHSFDVKLEKSKDFYQLNLNKNMNEELMKLEKQ